MNAKPLSLRVLKLVLAVWWWGLIVGAAVILIYVAVAPSKIDGFAIWGYASDIDTSTLSATDRNGQRFQVSFDSPTLVKLTAVEVAGQNDGVLWRRLSGLVVLLYFFLCLFFVKQLRDIVRTVDQADPFVEANARRIRVAGVLIFVFLGIECLGRLAMSGYADSVVIAEGFNLNGRIKVNEGLAVVAIAMLVLSEVFRHGARMREEQSLTV